MKNFSIYRGGHINFSCFSSRSSVEDKLTLFKNVAFSGEGKTEVPGKKSPSGQCKLTANSLPGSEDSHKKGRGTQKFWKEPIRDAKILFCERPPGSVPILNKRHYLLRDSWDIFCDSVLEKVPQNLPLWPFWGWKPSQIPKLLFNPRLVPLSCLDWSYPIGSQPRLNAYSLRVMTPD